MDELKTPRREGSGREVKATERQSVGFDLLHLRLIRRLVMWAGFPYVVQSLLLAVFVALALVGWGHYAPGGVDQKLYAKTNLATHLIWGLWWMAVLLGRAWCMVCPLELVSNVSERVGRRLGL